MWDFGDAAQRVCVTTSLDTALVPVASDVAMRRSVGARGV
jgi:hypothetical protein